MPRKPRHIIPGSVYHLISRFVDRNWFITAELERDHYLELLGRALRDSDWRCLAYAVMSNHTHLQAVAGKEPLSSWIRRVHSPFADALNRTHDRIGSVFARGPKAYLVPPHKFGRVLAYIHNNPVRAKVVAHARETTWTSHRAYAGLSRVPRWLHVNEGLERAGMSAASFDVWVDDNRLEGAEKTEPELFEELALEEAVEIDREPVVDADELVRVAATTLGIPVDDLCSRRKQDKHVLARRVVALCGDRLGLSGVSIARALGASQQCVSKILTCTDKNAIRPELVERVLQAATASSRQ